MERQFNACQTLAACTYLYFRVIRCLSQCVSPKIALLGTPLGHCLAACAHLTITVSEIERDIGRKSSFFHTLLHSTPPLGGFPSEQRHPVWYGKTRMAWLPDGEKISKISLVVLAQLTNVTDRQTDGRTDGQTPGDGKYTALMHSIAR